jgi:hypothetical protein
MRIDRNDYLSCLSPQENWQEFGYLSVVWPVVVVVHGRGWYKDWWDAVDGDLGFACLIHA